MLLLFQFSQSDLQIVYILLQLSTLILQLALLSEHIRAHLFLVLQPFQEFLDFGLQLDLSLDEQVTAFLSVCQVVLLL